jgi:ferredoxin-NADP reductase
LEAALEQRKSVPNCFICGPTPFVETAADGLVSAGVPPEKIRTERFGPTGS